MKQIYRDFRTILLAGLVAFLVCWGSNNWLFSEEHYHVDADKWLQDQLHFSAEQEQKLAPIEAEYNKRRSGLISQIHVANDELAKTLIQEKQYSARVKAASEHVDELQTQLKEITLEHFYKIQPVLTPKQLEKMNELVVHALSHHE